MRVKCVILVFMLLGSMPAFSQQESNFVVWQLPSQINAVGNSYVFQTNDGKIAVMDGGFKGEADYLRGFLAAGHIRINGEDISLSLSIDNWNFDRKSIIQKSNTKSITDRYIIDYNEEEFFGVTK